MAERIAKTYISKSAASGKQQADRWLINHLNKDTSHIKMVVEHITNLTRKV
jgi:hypothetical protein